MSDPRERLSRLVELATGNTPEQRRRLATELCDLLLDWPANYPPAMREPFETLLEKTLRLIDRQTRGALLARIADASALDFLNEFFFDAPPALRADILARNAAADAADDAARPVDEAALVALLRARPRPEFAETLAAALDLTVEISARILDDAEALALAAKGAHLSRAAFSALALLADGTCAPDETLNRLTAFETVPQVAAERMLGFWRGTPTARHAA
jgi:hypothetical protein